MEYKYKLSLCLLIRNESEYINDFLEHYVKQGVEHFYIVNNKSSDNTNDILCNSKYYNMITLIQDNNEYDLYNDPTIMKNIYDKHFYDIIKRETEWALIVDIDEFMFGKNGYTIKSYVESLPSDIGCVYVMWNIINPYRDEYNMLDNNFSIQKSKFRINWDLIQQLSYEVIYANAFGKSVFRTANLVDEIKLWIHKVCVREKRLINYDVIDDTDYDNLVQYSQNEENYKKVNITLHHYVIRNYNDYIRKKRQLTIPCRFQFIKGVLDILNVDSKYLIEDNLINETV
jgi:hypothetical protein